jgi:hypothetical protein
MWKVAIVGAGDIAAATARAIVQHEIAGDVRLIDEAADVARGKALDIAQSGTIDGSDVRVTGYAELTAAAGADVVVIADRSGSPGEWVGEPALDMVRQIEMIAPTAPLVFAGARQYDVLGHAWTDLRIPARRLIGSAPEAFAACARALTAAASGASPADLCVPVIGIPSHWVVAWSDARFGRDMTRRLPPHMLLRIEAQIAASWPPGPHTLASAAARVVSSILTASLRQATVFTPAAHYPGQRPVVTATPATFVRSGIRDIHVPVLSARERVLLETAHQRAHAVGLKEIRD